MRSKRRKGRNLTKKRSKRNKPNEPELNKIEKSIIEPLPSLLLKKSKPHENKNKRLELKGCEPKALVALNFQTEEKNKQNTMPKMDLEEYNNINSTFGKIIQNNVDVFKSHKPTAKGEIAKDSKIIQPLPLYYSNEKWTEVQPNTFDLQHSEEKPFDFDKPLIDPHDKRNIKYEDTDFYDANRDSIVHDSSVAPEIFQLEKTDDPNQIEIEPSIIKLKHNEEEPVVKAIQYAKQYDPDKPLLDPYDTRKIKYENEDYYDANRDSIVDDSFIAPGIVELEDAHKPLEFLKHSENVPRYPFKNLNAINLQQTELELSKLSENNMKTNESLENPKLVSTNEPPEHVENKSNHFAKSSSRCFCMKDALPGVLVQQPVSDSLGTLKESQKLLQMDHQIHQVTVVQNTDSLLIKCKIKPAIASIENATVELYFKLEEIALQQPFVTHRERPPEVKRECQPTHLEKQTTRDVVTLILPKNQLDTNKVQDFSHPKTMQEPETEMPLSQVLKRVRARNRAECLHAFKKSLETDLATNVESVVKCPPGKTPHPPCAPMCPPPAPRAPESYPPQPCKPLCPTPGGGQCPPNLPLPPDKKDPCCPKFDFSKHFPTYMMNGCVSLVQQRMALRQLNPAQNNLLITKDRYRFVFGDCSPAADVHRPRLLPVKAMSGFGNSFACQNFVNLLPRGCKANEPWAPALGWPEVKKQAYTPLACFKKECPRRGSTKPRTFSIGNLCASWSAQNSFNV